MPIYHKQELDNGARVILWHVTETEQELAAPLTLSQRSIDRLSGMSSELHRRGFLSIRHLLADQDYTDHDLTYTDDGRPRLPGKEYVSITHSFEFTGIIIAPFPIGIDIERQRDKILRIAHKFIRYEQLPVPKYDRIQRLTQIWCAKESIYKLLSIPGLSFRNNMFVETRVSNMPQTAIVIDNGRRTDYELRHVTLPGFHCTYIWQQ